MSPTSSTIPTLNAPQTRLSVGPHRLQVPICWPFRIKIPAQHSGPSETTLPNGLGDRANEILFSGNMLQKRYGMFAKEVDNERSKTR